MSRSPLLLLSIVMLSGAGLLALGVTSLWRGVRDADARAREAARQDTAASVRRLQRALVDPRVLAGLPAPGRFQVAAGQVQVPAELGWWRVPPAEPAPGPELPGAARDLLARADAATWHGDLAPAAAALAEALTVPGVMPAGRAQLLTAAAWLAQRRGDAACAQALLADGDALPAAAWAESTVALGRALLRAVRREPLPADTGPALVRLAPAAAAATLVRLREHGADTEPLAHAVAAAAVTRAALAQAVDHLPLLLAARAPLLQPLADGALLYFPTTVDTGAGAVATGAELLRAAASLGDEPLAGQPVFGRSEDPDLLPVVGSALGLLPRAPVAAGLGGPWLLSALLVVLAASFALALWFAQRAQRHETQALRSRAEFLTSVTHELKTPLASLRLLAEMLDGGRVAGEDERQEYYRLLANESVRLSALLDNVLDVGRMERGERAYDLRPLDLGALAAEVVELFTPLASAAALQVTLTVPTVPVPVRGDRAALQQALLNVLDNARKYAAAGARVQLELVAQDGRASVTVRDFGPGVPAAQRERIFGRFVRGVADGHPAPGVGLGLYLGRTILRAHGGDLVCAAPADGGAGVVFAFTLPLRAAAAVPA